ncbi:DUF4136 domain-containing protein [Pararhodonellum marinum]|uniref:DUF4136 domain-containing protein n=1 Tax=Pararhodonellum marinum TaxID=2755358 RepID=UPI003741F70A
MVQHEISRQMKIRGIEKVDIQPDLRVNLGISIKAETHTRETSLVTDPGTFTYIGQRRYTWQAETIEIGKYKEGSLTLDLVDNSNNQPAWIGVLEGILPENEKKT